ncbi:hypothetical protein C8J56DRAFT_880801 [Mycena floridula]|nr:hypothetical protein C8J56DRAFT_880801 [Mycena floridula]
MDHDGFLYDSIRGSFPIFNIARLHLNFEHLKFLRLLVTMEGDLTENPPKSCNLFRSAKGLETVFVEVTSYASPIAFELPWNGLEVLGGYLPIESLMCTMEETLWILQFSRSLKSLAILFDRPSFLEDIDTSQRVCKELRWLKLAASWDNADPRSLVAVLDLVTAPLLSSLHLAGGMTCQCLAAFVQRSRCTLTHHSFDIPKQGWDGGIFNAGEVAKLLSLLPDLLDLRIELNGVVEERISDEVVELFASSLHDYLVPGLLTLSIPRLLEAACRGRLQSIRPKLVIDTEISLVKEDG